MNTNQTNEMLGYPPGARLLIINADDLGIYPAANAGIRRTFEAGAVRSTSLMTVCSATAQAIELLQQHPEIAFGIHLTLISDNEELEYAPLTPPRRVPSLVNPVGNFYSSDIRAEVEILLATARLEEVEIEFRAQIERVLTAGLHPAHLDWHCLASGGRPDIFELCIQLAKEYGTALRADEPRGIATLQTLGLPGNAYPLLDSCRLDTATKPALYRQLLRDLPPGLSVWSVHPALGTPDARVYRGWEVRAADYAYFTSPAARDAIREEGILLLDYKLLQAIWHTL